MTQKLAVVLFNLGGPDGPDAVRPFLFNLFRDPAIIGAPAPIRGAGRGGFLDTVWLGGYQGRKSERNSQLQRLRSRPFFTRFG